MAFADKVKKLIKSRAFLFRLIATILVFICIPLLAIQIFFVNESTDEFHKNNHEHYLTLLQNSAQSFASREEYLFDLAWRMSQNDDIRKPLRLTPEEYPLLDKEAADALGAYGTDIPYAQIAGVFYTSKDYLLFNGVRVPYGVKYTLRQFCEKVEGENVEKARELEAFFRDLEYFSYYPSSDGTILIAARPISLGAFTRNDAIAFFIMDNEEMEESYRTAFGEQSSIAVLDENGNFLLRGKEFAANVSNETLNRFLSSGDNIGSAGETSDLLLYRYTDHRNQLTFLLATDRDTAQQNLLNFANKVQVTMYVMVAVILVALLATIYITYRPVYLLLQKYGKTEEQHPGSEFERLDSALFALDRETEAQQELLTDFILGDLLFGNAVKGELITRYFPEDRYKFFTVLTAMCPTLTSGEAKQMEEMLEDVTNCDVYVTSIPTRPHTVVACLSKDSIDPNELHYHAVRVLKELTGEECPVGVGDVVQEIQNLRKSYRSAVIVNADPMKAEPGSNAGELEEKLQTLCQCVYMGDEEESLKQLEDIRRFLYSNTVGEGHLRYYGFKLLHTYLTSVNSGQSQLSGQEVELLLSFTGMDHLFKLLAESIHQVCSQVADMEHTVGAQMQQRLIEYVDEHFTESELCLANVADYVGASIYAVSRLFKEITGTGFKEYVTEKRLEYGHQLLSTTDKSVTEIAVAAGFYNSNYFSTIFKTKYGLPPTKYRSKQKNNQDIE